MTTILSATTTLSSTYTLISDILHISRDLPAKVVFEHIFNACSVLVRTKADGACIEYKRADGALTMTDVVYRSIASDVDITIIYHQVGLFPAHGPAIIFHRTRACVSIMNDELYVWKAHYCLDDTRSDRADVIWALHDGAPTHINGLVNMFGMLPNTIWPLVCKKMLQYMIKVNSPIESVTLESGENTTHIPVVHFRRFCPGYKIDGNPIVLDVMPKSCWNVISELFDTATYAGDWDLKCILNQLSVSDLAPFIAVCARLGIKLCEVTK